MILGLFGHFCNQILVPLQWSITQPINIQLQLQLVTLFLMIHSHIIVINYAITVAPSTGHK